VVDSASFARDAASRAEHSCFGVSAARKPKQLLDIFVFVLDSEDTIPRCKTLGAIGIPEVSHWTALTSHFQEV